MGNEKPEINLEICTGFFRIATDKVVYNITVLNTPESPATPVVSRIVEEERGHSQTEAPQPVLPAAAEAPFSGDDYYKQVSTDIYKDIGQLAKSLSATIMEIPAEDRKLKRAELDEAGEKIEDAKNQLRDVVAMTEKATMEIMDHVEKVQAQTDDVKELLAQLKHHQAFLAAAEEEAAEADSEHASQLKERIAALKEAVERLKTDLGELESAEKESPDQPEAPEEQAVPAARRYPFQLDVVFQTIYELCTNETVKEHITTARTQAQEIFDADRFIDELSAKVAGMEPDGDNFFNVPLSDVLTSLLAACSDKKIQNLLKKMDANQGDIFLDTTLPLEAPPAEDAGEPAPEQAQEEGEASPRPACDPAWLAKVGEDLGAIEEAVAAIEAEAEQLTPALPAGMSRMSLEDQADIFRKIENAFGVATSICEDVTRITEALSFQDLSGQQIMKIIKLLSDFQVQLLAIVVSFGTQLKSKEQNAAITPEESKRLAQEEVDRYLKGMAEAGKEGPLDQETVNKMLEELGF